MREDILNKISEKNYDEVMEIQGELMSNLNDILTTTTANLGKIYANNLAKFFMFLCIVIEESFTDEIYRDVNIKKIWQTICNVLYILSNTVQESNKKQVEELYRAIKSKTIPDDPDPSVTTFPLDNIPDPNITTIPANISDNIEYVKSCILIDEHLKKCKICHKKFSKKKNIENFRDALENITPNQKNLLIIIIYGILIILISKSFIRVY